MLGELRDLTATVFRTSGTFYFKPLDDLQEVDEHRQLAREVAAVAVDAAAEADANSGSDAVARVADAVAFASGGFRYFPCALAVSDPYTRPLYFSTCFR